MVVVDCKLNQYGVGFVRLNEGVEGRSQYWHVS